MVFAAGMIYSAKKRPAHTVVSDVDVKQCYCFVSLGVPDPFVLLNQLSIGVKVMQQKRLKLHSNMRLLY